MQTDEEEDNIIYKVVINHEEQYSIWPVEKENPLGWSDVGKSGPKKECLDHINEVWTDMRPLSLRKHMEEMERRRPELEKEHEKRLAEERKKKKDPRDNLVKYLSTGSHPVEAGLRPKETAEELKECIDRRFVYVKFTDTRGGTELGITLDENESDWEQADFEKGTGKVRLVGNLTLNYVRVKCISDIELSTLKGKGHLQILEDTAKP